MSWASVASSRLRGLFAHKRLERELAAEVRFHLEMQVEDNLKAGMRPAEARAAARRSFGVIEPMKEIYRDRSAFAVLERVARDIRYAVRTLRRSPGFTTASVATLALAIGGNTAMFSVLNAVLLRPLPYREPDRLAMLWTEIPSQQVRKGRSSYQSIEEWRKQSESFTDLAFFDPVSVMLMNETGAEQVSVLRTSPNLFPLLGIQPAQGRAFSEQEAEQRQRLAVISHRFWRGHFGGSADAIGKSIQLDGAPTRIIGVLPADFQFSGLDADVWEAHTMFPDWEARRGVGGADTWFAVGRLRPEATFEQAQSEMSAIARRQDERLAEADRNRGISVEPLSLHVVGTKSRLALWMLTVAVFFVLLIAAANVASLSLARGVSRAREMAIRSALGASPMGIVRQLLTESLSLAAMSGVLGSVLAFASIGLVRTFGPAELARLQEASLDLEVLGWALAISAVTGLLVGLAPAAIALGRNQRLAGEEGGRSVSGGIASAGIRRALVVSEFALAIMLLVGAGLLVRSWWLVESVDPGFRPERLLSIQMSIPAELASGQRVIMYNRVLEGIQALPGVESAGIIGDLFVDSNPVRALRTEGGALPISEGLRFRRDEVSEGFFKALGTPLLRGRFFSAEDRADAPPVAIINDVMARRLWPGLDAVGKRFTVGPSGADTLWFTVVGVVGDMRRQGPENEPIPQIFEPLAQNPSRLATLVVRTTADDPLKMVGALQDAVRGVEKQALLYRPMTLENRIGAFLAQRRFQTALLIAFAGVALLMAAIGIYGLIQYSIAMRTHEIGIRMAVGARAGDIFRMVIREGLTLSLMGLALGLVGALWLGQAGSSLLFGVSPTDPLTLASVSLLLTLVAVAACHFPARRAMKVEPVVALRQQ